MKSSWDEKAPLFRLIKPSDYSRLCAIRKLLNILHILISQKQTAPERNFARVFFKFRYHKYVFTFSEYNFLNDFNYE